MNLNQKISFDELLPIIKEELEMGRSIAFTAFGNSMCPTIRGGLHHVTLSPLNSPPKKGDILFYRRENGMFVLHRLCKIKKDGSYVFFGDNQFTPENEIDDSNIIAKLTKLELNGKDVTPSPRFQVLYTNLLSFRRIYLRLKLYFKRFLKKLFT